MIKKQFIAFAIGLLSFSFLTNYCMEESIAEKSKAPRSRVEESGRAVKKQKYDEKQEVFEEKESNENTDELVIFDKLPIEVLLYMCEMKLQDIIEGNSIFTPLDGVKEFLNAIALVSRKFDAVATDLGWNKCLVGQNIEPKYKMMVKKWFVSNDIRSKDSDTLNLELKAILANGIGNIRKIECQITSMIICTDVNHSFAEDKEINTIAYNKAIDTLSEVIAEYMIAGANPNIQVDDMYRSEPLLLVIIELPRLHPLIRLLLLRGVNTQFKSAFKRTVLMHAIKFPEVLKMLLDYDKSNINDLDYWKNSALHKAIKSRNIESLKLLLENGADTHWGLCLIMHYETDFAQLLGMQSDEDKIEVPKEHILDKKIAKLLIKYGAQIDDIPQNASHPFITREWLIKRKKIEDAKKRIALAEQSISE